MGDISPSGEDASKDPAKPTWRTWELWARIGKVAAGIIAAAAAIFGILASLGVFSSAPSSTFSFTNPSPDATTPEPGNFIAKGSGVPTGGRSLVLAVKETDSSAGSQPPLYFHHGLTTIDPQQSSWSIEIQAGDSNTDSTHTYELLLVEMDATWAQYLTRSVYSWKAADFPPDSKVVATANISREPSVCQS